MIIALGVLAVLLLAIDAMLPEARYRRVRPDRYGGWLYD